MQKSFGVAKVLTLMLGLTALATVPVHADTISYQNALVTLNVTSNNYVTVTITNTLSNSQVTSVGSNISGLYFDVTGYTGSGAALSSSSGQTTDIYGHVGYLQGITSTGCCEQLWLRADSVCHLCVTGSEPDCTRDDDSGREWLGFVCERKLFNQQQWPSQSLSRRNCFLHALRARRYGRLTI